MSPTDFFEDIISEDYASEAVSSARQFWFETQEVGEPTSIGVANDQVLIHWKTPRIHLEVEFFDDGSIEGFKETREDLEIEEFDSVADAVIWTFEHGNEISR